MSLIMKLTLDFVTAAHKWIAMFLLFAICLLSTEGLLSINEDRREMGDMMAESSAEKKVGIVCNPCCL